MDSMVVMFFKFVLQFLAFIAMVPVTLACAVLRLFGLSLYAEKARMYLEELTF